MGPFLAVSARGFDWYITSDLQLRLTRVIVPPQALQNREMPDADVGQHRKDVVGRGGTGGKCRGT